MAALALASSRLQAMLLSLSSCLLSSSSFLHSVATGHGRCLPRLARCCGASVRGAAQVRLVVRGLGQITAGH